jgi:hypothetical protein
MKIKALLVALLLMPVAARADQEMPIFDAHLHYSHVHEMQGALYSEVA